jgi:hypothetical protein
VHGTDAATRCQREFPPGIAQRALTPRAERSVDDGTCHVTKAEQAGRRGDDTEVKADRICPRTFESELSSYRTLRVVSTAGFIAGGVLAATGVTLLLTAPRKPSKPAVGLWLSPSTAGITGDF